MNGSRMSAADFVDESRIREAIARAEETTTAPITVTIADASWGNISKDALRDLRSRARSGPARANAVHFYVVPGKRKFAVVGNGAAHGRLGQDLFDRVAATVEPYFRSGDPTAGLVAGIEMIGAFLAQTYPKPNA